MLATAHAAAGRVRASDEDARVGVKTILLDSVSAALYKVVQRDAANARNCF